MYRCSLIPYAVRSALRTEHVRSLRNGISLKMAKYPVKSTSQSTYGRMERSSSVSESERTNLRERDRVCPRASEPARERPSVSERERTCARETECV
ncbi:hypothetical protein DPX16_23653 [Anabarilius grahami]|uniref:Uncharacterized protein n=1 Tax=Anabarilius grahami TaxID=495550 RepID=A0A3N0XQG5_ANAGA|nr:hypothetical protein DPX16_23653 [Anabarilius grahami]